MTAGVQGYIRSGFSSAALNAAWCVRLASKRQEVVCVFHLGQRIHRTVISHVFHAEHLKKANHLKFYLIV